MPSALLLLLTLFYAPSSSEMATGFVGFFFLVFVSFGPKFIPIAARM